MNVNEIAKMNQLMKELQKHGIAQSAPDAFQQAQEIVSDEPKKVITIDEEGLTVETATVPGSALIESRVNLMLDMHNKKIESNFITMRDTISALAMEIEKLKFELKKFSDNKAHKVVQVVQETQKSLKTEEKTAHPRQGNYSPGDVAIDKMFYYGHK